MALSAAITTTELNNGRLYPVLDNIREVCLIVARKVIRQAQRQDLDGVKSLRELSDDDLDSWIRSKMYDPTKEGATRALL